MSRPGWSERGGALIVVLLLLLVISLAGLAILAGSDSDLAATRSYADSLAAQSDTDAGLSELLWRLDLPALSSPAPAGQLVSVNELTGFPARIEPDPERVLSNGVDDDADGTVDEPDELNLVRDWQLRVLLSPRVDHPGAPFELQDTSIATGPPWGSRRVTPTIQPSATWRRYTAPLASDADVLTLRFKLDTDTALGDSEKDGPEVVFYDPALVTNGVDDRNTLWKLGGDGDPGNDSPYNITWSDGRRSYPASGEPVLLVRLTGRTLRAGRVVARRPVEAEIVGSILRVPRSWALCGCQSARIDGERVDSYRSSEGAYGSGPRYRGAHVGSNGDIEVKNDAIVEGSLEAGGAISVKNKALVTGDATAGGGVQGAAQILGTVRPFTLPVPRPCDCSSVSALVAAAAASNDNARILPNNLNPYLYGTSSIDIKENIYKKNIELSLGKHESIILPDGSYYFDELTLDGDSVLQVGRDTDANGLVDRSPDAPVRIHVAGEVKLSKNARLYALRPRDVLILSSSSKKAVDVGGDAQLAGVIQAPLGTFELDGKGQLFGSATALEVDVKSKASVHMDEDLRQAGAPPTRHRVIAWRELE